MVKLTYNYMMTGPIDFYIDMILCTTGHQVRQILNYIWYQEEVTEQEAENVIKILEEHGITHVTLHPDDTESFYDLGPDNNIDVSDTITRENFKRFLLKLDPI